MFRSHWQARFGEEEMNMSHSMLRRSGLIAALLIAALLAFTGDALALSGSPVNVGSHFDSLAPAPSVAVDSAGNAHIAWVDEEPSGTSGDTILYCAIPAGATGCSHSQELKAGGGANPHIDKVQVLVDGATVVVLADVYGVGEEYEPEQEWTSTDGGATFAVVNGGNQLPRASSAQIPSRLER